MPPALTEMVGSPRVLVPAGLADAAGWLDEPDVVRTGEMCAMAEPGRAGRFLAASALFWASMASRRLGLLEVMVLLDRPRPGRTGGASADFLGELGLCGSLLRSFWAVESRSAMILSRVSRSLHVTG